MLHISSFFPRAIFSIGVLVLFLSPLIGFSQNEWLDGMEVTYDDCDGCLTVSFRIANRETAGFQDLAHKLEIEFTSPSTLLGSTNFGGGTFFLFEENNDATYPNMEPIELMNENLTVNRGGYYYIKSGGTFDTVIRGGTVIPTGIIGGEIFGIATFCDLPSDLFGAQTEVLITGFYDYNPGTGIEILENTKLTSAAPPQLSAKAPTGLSATQGDHCGHVRLSWSNVGNNCLDATNSTLIHRSLQGVNSYSLIDSVPFNNTSYDDVTAVLDVEYDYKINHKFKPNIYRSSLSSMTGSATGYKRKSPVPPSNLMASTSLCNGSVDLSWTNIGTDLVTINVYRNGQLIGQPAAPATSFTDMNPLLNVDASYQLRVSNNCGVVSTYTSVVTGYAEGPPDIATNVVADTALGGIRLTWSDNSSIEEGYILERTTPGGGSPFIINQPINATSYIDTDVLQCITYTYTVKVKTPCHPVGAGTNSSFNALGPDLTGAFETDGTGFRASKGYFTDRVELTWSNRNEGQTNVIKIYRRILGSGDLFTLITTQNANSGIYNDNNTDAGILYEYEIQAEGPCGNNVVLSNIVSTVGFRSKSGIVSGNVSYEGDIAVEHVKIVGERAGVATGKSIELNEDVLSILHDDNQNVSDELVLEAWIKPSMHTAFDIIAKDMSYRLYHDINGQYKMTIWDQGGAETTAHFDDQMISINNWHHIAGQVRNDSLFLYLNGDKVASEATTGTLDIRDTNSSILIGQYLSGCMKEVRMWSQSKTDIEIKRNSSRYAVGSDLDLITLLPMDEGAGESAYDRSQSAAALFNRNHALLGDSTMWVDNAPTSSQLSYAAYTETNGNYIIKLPYTNAGENYTLTPIFNTHAFDPSTQVLFIGDGSTVINGVDFTDVSAFTVTGNLFYNNTPCAVEGAQLRIDGDLIIKNGAPVETDSDGNFEVLVPIGEHVLTIEKQGHVFNQGRFPSSDSHDFQAPVSGISFKDSTKVRVVGRVVGGLVEANKKPGHGLSKNNIGVSRIILEAQQGNGCHIDTVFTDPSTGEYQISIPPQNYIPSVSVTNNPVIGFDDLDLVNLSGPPVTTTVRDTLFEAGGNTILEIDSISFEKQLDYIHRVDPKVIVRREDGKNPFIGDTTYTYQSNGSSIIRNLIDEPLRWPVFSNLNLNHYSCMIMAFEEYINSDNGVIDSVSTTDGTIHIENDLAVTPDQSINLSDVNFNDTVRFLVYKFTLGDGNLLESDIPVYSFTKKFALYLETADGSMFPWEPVSPIPTGGDGVFRGYVLTPKSQGQQFVTNGPDQVEFILRDPPGSGSSASREIGSTDTRSASWSWDAGSGVSAQNFASVGILAQLGSPVAMTETDNFVRPSIGLEVEISAGRNGTTASTSTNTMEWATDGTPVHPGAKSDLFIGTSQNVTFGIIQSLAFVPESECTKVECIGQSFDGFRATKFTGLSVVPKDFNTGFIYSQFHIENTLIPNLKELRNAILLSDGRYTSNLDISDVNYGKNNDDPIFGDDRIVIPNVIGDGFTFESTNGPSYLFDAENLSIDSVRSFNVQINIWEETLRLNEWEKANIDKTFAIDSLRTVELDKNYAEYESDIIAYAILSTIFSLATIQTFSFAIVPLPPATVAGGANFAIATGTGIAAAEVSQRFNEYEQKRDRIIQRFGDISATNYSISSGASFNSSMSHSQVAGFSNSVEFSGTSELALEVQVLVNNNGFNLSRALSLNFNQSRDWSTETEATETVSYTLADEDRGDFMSVDVYPSIFGWGPIFKRRAGGLSSCPYEGEEVTNYYNPGTVIAEATQRVDDFSISASPTIQTNIPGDEAAAFNLTIGNLSASTIERTYVIEVYSESNPFGAIVKIDGVSASTEVFMGPGTSINKVITIEKGAGAVYEYNDIQVAVYAACEPLRSEVVKLSAHFLPTCTEATLASPEDQWVLNNSFNDTMPITIIDYNINTFDLERLRFDYKSSDDPNWIALKSFWKDTTGVNETNPFLIPTNSSFITYDWDVGQITDGSYDLRVVSICEQAQSISEIHRGYMDRINPHAFGTPSPGDGILDPGDDVLLTVNEPIETGTITSLNFDVRGVLNGTTLRHETSLGFDGANDYGIIPEYQLQQRSLTIEFWLKRARTGSEVIVSQGPNQTDQVSVFFDSENKMNLQIGDQKVTSNIPSDDQWHHYALVYDRSNQNAEIFIDFIKEATDNNFIVDYTSSGSILIGKDASGSIPQLFQGMMHELRLWGIPKSEAQIAAQGNISLSGREAGLIGNWKMDEGYGSIAADIVRSRHAQLSGTTWSILPSNHAFMFDGIDDYLEATNGGSLAFNDETDITIEAWFKTGASKAQSILSNGKADGTRPEHTAWNIYINSSGAIVVENYGHQTYTPSGYNDNNWHHISAVIQRNQAVTLYIDGQVVATGNAAVYNAWGGPQLWVGSRGWFEGALEKRDQFWEGKLDDIRIWNVARTSEQVSRDFVYQLQGDEAGLEAYYPFDGIIEDLGVIGRIPIRNDASTSLSLNNNDYNLSLGGNMLEAFSNDAPPVQLPRLIQKVNITYSINNDQIFIDITDPPAQIENVTLDITVSGIKDLAGNVMQSPETWIAYVDKNQVFWEDEYFSFIKNTQDNLSFTAKIKNTGGSQEQFSLSNLPSWLSASPLSGLINPNSSVEVTFNISSNINIGEYEQDIFVTTESFGFNERLLLDLEVKADPPDWSVDPTAFSGSMSYVGEVTINGLISTDEDDIITASLDGDLRGLGHVAFSPGSGKYLVFLDIYGGTIENLSADNGKKIEFKLWDASTNKIHPYVSPFNHIYENGVLRGSSSNPVPFEAQDDVEIEYDIRRGWNWISFPLESIALDSFELMVSELNVSPGDRIFSHTQTALYVNDVVGWQMNASLEQNGLRIEDGYRLYISSDDTLVYRGIFRNPEEKPINLASGWNSIGFISENSIDISTALSSLDPSDGDWIKGQQSFAVYEAGFGWEGSLLQLDPKVSYLINLSGSDILTYPNTQGSNLRSLNGPEQEALYTEYGISPGEHEYSMSMIVTVEGYSEWDQNDDWLMASYNGDQIIGINPISYNEARNNRLSYLTVYGNSGDTLSFRLLSADGSIVTPLVDEHLFVVDGTLGLPRTPKVLHVNGPCIDHIDIVTDYTDYLTTDHSIIAAKTITGRTPILSDQLIRFEAGESIFLESGFEVSSGSPIEFIIKPCEQ